MLSCEQWIRQIPKELLQQAGHTVDVVKEVLRVSEIHLGSVYVLSESNLWSRRLLTYHYQTWP